MKKHGGNKNVLRRMMSLMLCAVMCVSMLGTSFAAELDMSSNPDGTQADAGVSTGDLSSVPDAGLIYRDDGTAYAIGGESSGDNQVQTVFEYKETGVSTAALSEPSVTATVNYRDKINRFTTSAAARVDITVSGGGGVWYEYDEASSVNGTGYYGLGTHNGKVRAVDGAGNVGPWKSFSFTVSNNAPAQPTITATTNYNDYVNGFTSACMIKVNVSVTGSDPDVGDSYQFDYEAGSINLTGYYLAGSYNVKCRAIDEWGATSAWTTRSFSITKPSISVSLTSPTLGGSNSISGNSATLTFSAGVSSTMPYRIEFMDDSYASSANVQTKNNQTSSSVTFGGTYSKGRHMPVVKATSMFGDSKYAGLFFIVGDTTNAGSANFSSFGSSYGEAALTDNGVAADDGTALAYISSFKYNGGYPGHAAGGDLAYVIGYTQSGQAEIVFEIGPCTTYKKQYGNETSLPWSSTNNVGTTSTFTCTGNSNGTITFSGSEWGTVTKTWNPNKYVKMKFAFGSWHPSCCNGNSMDYSVTYSFISGAYDGTQWDSKVGTKPAVALRKQQAVGTGASSMLQQSANANDQVTYSIIVQNVGSTSASGISVSDAIPSGLTYVAGSASDGGSVSGSTISWPSFSLSRGQTKTLTFKVKVPNAAAASTWRNTATATYTNMVQSARSNEVVLTKQGSPSVAISKTQSINGGAPGTTKQNVKPNDVVTYTISARNTGVGVATNLTITDTIPAGLEVLQVGNPGRQSGNTITWSLGDLLADDTKTVTFVCKVPATMEPATWPNSASLTFGSSNTGTGNASSNTVEISKDGQAILSLDKFQSLNGGAKTKEKFRVIADDIVTYELVVKNIGHGRGTNIVLTDVVPAGLVYVGGSASDGGTESGGKITWNLGAMEKNETKSVTFSVRAPKTVEPADWSNTGTVKWNHVNSDSPETQTSNNVDIDKDGQAVLEIHETQDLNSSGNFVDTLLTVEADDIVTYKLFIENVGKGAASDVAISSAIPDGLSLVAGSISDGGREAGGVLTWNIGPLAKGASKSVTFQVKIPTTLKPADWHSSSYVSYVHVNDRLPVVATSNTVDLHKDGEAILNISEKQSLNNGAFTTDVFDDVEYQDVVTYKIFVDNSGYGTSRNTVVTGHIPGGLTLVPGSITGSGVQNGSDITWNIGAMAPGGKQEFQFQVSVPQTDDVTMWTNESDLVYGHVNSKIPVSKTSNRVSMVKDGMPGLLIDKKQQLNEADRTTDVFETEAADIVTYYLTVTNVGKGDARNSYMTDVVPKGLKYVPGSITAGGTYADGVITWQLGWMEPNDTITVSYQVEVPVVMHPTVYDNMADVFYYHTNGKEYVTHASNVVEFTKDGQPILEVDIQQSHNSIDNMTVEDLTVEAGHVMTYLITLKNTGDGVAKTVRVENFLPAGLEIVEGSISMSGTTKVEIDDTPVDPSDQYPDVDDGEEPDPSPSPEAPETPDEGGDEEGNNDSGNNGGNNDNQQPEAPDSSVVSGESSASYNDRLQALLDGLARKNGTSTAAEGESDGGSSEGEPDGGSSEPPVTDGTENPDGSAGGNGDAQEPDGENPDNNQTPGDGNSDGNGDGDALPKPEEPDEKPDPDVPNNPVDDFGEGQSITWDVPDMAAGDMIQFTFQAKVPETKYEHTWDDFVRAYYTHTNHKNVDTVDSNTVRIWKDGMAEMTIAALQSLNGSQMQKESFIVRAGEIVTYNLVLKNTGNGTAKDVHVVTAIPEGLIPNTAIISHEGSFVELLSDISIFGYTFFEDDSIFNADMLDKLVFDLQNPGETPDENPDETPEHPDENPGEGEENPDETPDNQLEQAARFYRKEFVTNGRAVNGFQILAADETTGGDEIPDETLGDGSGDETPDENPDETPENPDENPGEGEGNPDGTPGDGNENPGEGDGNENQNPDETPGDGDEHPDGQPGEGDGDSDGDEPDGDYPNAGYMVWHLGNIPKGESVTLSFSVQVPETQDVTHWENFATLVYGHTNDPYPVAIDSNKLELDKDGMPELDIQKYQSVNGGEFTQNVQEVTTDDEITYKLVVSNRGKGVAEHVIVTDSVDASLELLAASLTNGRTDGMNNLTFELGDMAVGDEIELTFTFVVPDVVEATTWKNMAHVAYGHTNLGDDLELDSNEVSVTNEGIPDLVISELHVLDGQSELTEEALVVSAGDIVRNELTVENKGTMTADKVVITTKVEQGLTVVPNSISDDGVLDGDVITWTFDTLPFGESKTVSFKTKVPDVYEPTEWHNNGVLKYANNPNNPDGYQPDDPDSGAAHTMDSNIVTIMTQGMPGLRIEKLQSLNGGAPTADNLKLSPGDKLTYHITVTSVGEVTANHIMILDAVPEGLILDNESVSDGGEITSDGLIVWNIDSLAVDASQTVSFTVTVPESTQNRTYANTALVSGDFVDKFSSNTVNSHMIVDIFALAPTGIFNSGSLVAMACLALVLSMGGCVYLVYRRKKSEQ